MCASLPLALSLAFSRDRQRRRSSENTRIRNATAAQYAPTFCATKKRFPRSLPFDREPLASLAVLLSLSCTRPSHFSRLFAEFSNFPLSLSFSLSLSLVRVPAFLFPFDFYFLSLSLISFANFLADPISRNEREWTTRTYTATYCVRFTRADLLGRKSDQRIGFYRFYPGVEECVTEISSLEAGTR